jgi:hypothetical protein
MKNQNNNIFWNYFPLTSTCLSIELLAGLTIVALADDDPNYALAVDCGVKTSIFGSH